MASESAKASSETEEFLRDEERYEYTPPLRPTTRRGSFWIWVAFTCVNLMIASVSFFSYLQARTAFRGPFWDTDMLDARGAIQYEERKYTGALAYDYDKKEMIREADGKLEFFGPPSPEVDAAWHSLLRGQFPTMSDEEAEPFKPELTRLPEDNEYHFEPDMFHSLHCINAIRKELSKSFYNGTGYLGGHEHELPAFVFGNDWQAVHFDHCLDRLRQAVMCHGDMTPSPLFSFEGYPLNLGRSGSHTCRKFEPLRAWMDQRGSNGKADPGID